MDELISIIVPVYNVEKYLDRCVDSIVKQTYQNLEIILVDDGSQDDSGLLCDCWAEKDKRIKVIHKSNGGLSDARNVGKNQACGQYIGFIDGDDYISPYMYEKMYEQIKRNNADMAICNYDYVDENGKIISTENNLENAVMTPLQILEKLCSEESSYYVTAVNKLYDIELVKRINFPIGKLHEDEFTAHLFVMKCKRIVSIKERLYYYVQRSGSITNVRKSIRNLDAVEALLERADFLKSYGMEKLSYITLRQSYGIMIKLINQIEILPNQKRVFELTSQLIECFGLNLRVVKLMVILTKKMCHEMGAKIKFLIYLNKENRTKKEKIYIVATPSHGNLGDQAIVYAEYKFLHKIFPEKHIIEIRNEDYLRYGNLLEKKVKEKDIIIVDGGGNIGSLWPHEDDKIRDIILRFRDNKIIIFPQTCYFADNRMGRERMEEDIKAYEKCEKLVVMLREERSYNIFEKNLKKTSNYLVPDIVLSLKFSELRTRKREGVLFCFRSDVEKEMSEERISLIKKYIKMKKWEFSDTSTLVEKVVMKKNRKEEIEKKLLEFSSAKLVITDRLHAMIFSAITGTPCLAFDNKSHKVSGVYQWIKDLPYITCINNDIEMNEIYEWINQFYNAKEYLYNPDFILRRYKSVIERIVVDE